MTYEINYVKSKVDFDFENFDLLIFSITGESRAWLLPERARSASGKTWALARKNENLADLDLSAEIRRRLPNADLVLAQSFSSSLIAFMKKLGDRGRVFIDVSCMTRADMAVTFDELFNSELQWEEMELTIAYVIAEFSLPAEGLFQNEDIRPLSKRFAGWPSNPYASSTLILSLGYEAAKAEGAQEYFDAQESWVFFPESPISEYDVQVGKNNRQIVERATREARLVRYPVADPAGAFFRLNSLVQNICATSNPLILPFGPKIFAAISLIVAIINPSLGVWHATGDTDLPEHDHKASNEVVGLEISVKQLRSLVEDS